MKRTIGSLVIFASLFVLGVAPNLRAEEDRKCTNATLTGPYAAKQTAFFFEDREQQAGLGVVTFDGQGNWSAAVTFVGPNGVNRLTPSGTYTVNPDCTASMGPDVTFDIVILDGGNEVQEISTSRTDRVVTWVLRKQFLRHHDDEEN